MRRFRIPNLFDRFLWGRAGWSRIDFIRPSERPPVLVLVFQDADAACEIFTRWLAALGEIDFEDLVRVAVVQEGAHGMFHTYHVHLSIDPRAVARAAARRGAFVVDDDNGDADVWCSMRAVHVGQVQLFQEDYEAHGRYLIVPATIDGGLAPVPRLGVGKQRLHVRCARDVTPSDDPDAGLWHQERGHG